MGAAALRGLVLVTIVCAALGGCNMFGKRFGPSETEILQTGWIPRDPAPPPPQVYCYRTLAAVDCHPIPLEQPIVDERLVGAYGPTGHVMSGSPRQ